MEQQNTAPKLDPKLVEKFLADGFADLPLVAPVEVDGVKVSSLRMREPTVQDNLASNAIKGTGADQEVWLFATLCDVAPETIQRLKLRDYKKLQQYFLVFAS